MRANRFGDVQIIRIFGVLFLFDGARGAIEILRSVVNLNSIHHAGWDWGEVAGVGGRGAAMYSTNLAVDDWFNLPGCIDLTGNGGMLVITSSVSPNISDSCRVEVDRE